MARKPKAAPVTDVPQVATGAAPAISDDAPAPVRRGRKPKAAPVADVPRVVADAAPTIPDDAPAPVRRGRKPKAAAAPPQLATTVDDGDAAGRTIAAVAADTAIIDERDEPIRARPSRKPKQPVEDAAMRLPQDDVQEQVQPGAGMDQPETVQPIPDAGNASTAEMEVRGISAASSDAASDDGDPDRSADDAMPLLPGLETATRAKPAAHWDRVTDVVQFDWAEIGRTASQDGPNQIMAKLLIAARAEGANSRWPL